MIYITQLIFVREGSEALFHQFEEVAIPLIAKYNGQLIYRVRPPREAFISGEDELPYEIHLVSFPAESDLANFMKDDSRGKVIHLKEASVRSQLLIKGQKM